MYLRTGAFFTIMQVLNPRFITFRTCKTLSAYASIYSMTYEVVCGTVARHHTMITIIAFRTYCKEKTSINTVMLKLKLKVLTVCAMCTNPSRFTSTMSVISPASCTVFASAMVYTAFTISAFGTWLGTIGSCPSRQALAMSLK